MKDDTLFNLISKYRLHARLKANKKLHHNIHSAFFAFVQPQQNDQINKNHFLQRGGHNRGRDQKNGRDGPFFRKIQQFLECLCDLMH